MFEQPAASAILEEPLMLDLIAKFGAKLVYFDQCHFQTTYKKPTVLITNVPDNLLQVFYSAQCQHSGRHKVVLKGGSSVIVQHIPFRCMKL
jgi:hypothetical protein